MCLELLLNYIFLVYNNKEFCKLLANQISAEVVVINPFEKFNIRQTHLDDSYIKQMAPQAAICMGLSIRKLDDK